MPIRKRKKPPRILPSQSDSSDIEIDVTGTQTIDPLFAGSNRIITSTPIPTSKLTTNCLQPLNHTTREGTRESSSSASNIPHGLESQELEDGNADLPAKLPAKLDESSTPSEVAGLNSIAGTKTARSTDNVNQQSISNGVNTTRSTSIGTEDLKYSKRRRLESDSHDCPSNQSQHDLEPMLSGNESTTIELRENPDQRANPETSNSNLKLTSMQNAISSLPTNLDQAPNDPRPIYLTGDEDILTVIDNITAVIGHDNFLTKSTKIGIQITCHDQTSRQKLLNYINAHGIDSFTHQPPQERGFRVFIRHLHKSTPINWITDNLSQLGYTVRFAAVATNRFSKVAYNAFAIELEKTPSVENILDLTTLGNQQIEVEKLAPRRNIVQCYRCQLFGHTKNYCSRPYTCVKCAGNHKAGDCNKTSEEDAKCANCGGGHPASFRGCSSYKRALLAKRNIQPKLTTRAIPSLRKQSPDHSRLDKKRSPSVHKTTSLGRPNSPAVNNKLQNEIQQLSKIISDNTRALTEKSPLLEISKNINSLADKLTPIVAVLRSRIEAHQDPFRTPRQQLGQSEALLRHSQ